MSMEEDKIEAEYSYGVNLKPTLTLNKSQEDWINLLNEHYSLRFKTKNAIYYLDETIGGKDIVIKFNLK